MGKGTSHINKYICPVKSIYNLTHILTMKKSISLLLLSLLMIAPSCQKTKEAANEYNIVPKPNQILPQEGRFELNSKVSLVIPSDAPEVKGIADSLAERLNRQQESR